MNRSKQPSARSACSPEFLNWLRAILYSRKLTFGARCLGLAILDTPPEGRIKLIKFAKKLGTDTATVTKWKKQLLALKFTFLIDIPEAD